MGRVYTVQPDASKGERSGRGVKVCLHTGEEIPHVARVEFRGDTDRGTATVTAYYQLNGGLIADLVTNEAVKVEFTAWVQAVHPGQAPTKAPRDEVVVNPAASGPDDDPFVLWGELVAACEAMKGGAE